MSALLPTLRPTLDFFPSPNPDQPGWVIHDPYRYADTMLVLPPALASGIALFDGEHTELDLQVHFTRSTGEVGTSPLVRSLVDTLRTHGFLLTEEFETLRAAKEAEFARAPVRVAALAGSGYPADPGELDAELATYLQAEDLDTDRQGVTETMQGTATESGRSTPIVGIAAPHVSPHGGHASYASAYARFPVLPEESTVVILGTSHYGEPDRFGLTRKPFETPLGTLAVDIELVDQLVEGAGDSVIVEDYAQSIEHSIEFQCLFLQHVAGSGVRILPILCGPFIEEMTDGGVGRFFETLRGIVDRNGSRLFWILGIDLAHIGRRYGDDFDALAEQGSLIRVRAQDQERLRRVCEGDADGLSEMVQTDGDPLRWCGFSPLYTFLRVMPDVRADVWRYEQWNIDPQSVVSFAAIGFRKRQARLEDST